MRRSRRVSFTFRESDMFTLSDNSTLFGFEKRNPDSAMKCKCGWQGKHIDLMEVRYTSDSQSWQTMCGRDGWHYHCPRCNRLLDTYYFRVS